MMKARICFLLPVLFLGLACSKPQTRFELLPASATGITFNNLLTESDTFNVLTFEYIYNGGGVGVADFNNDGLSDLFFAGNMVSSRLYLNRGDLRFEDITESAHTGTRLWCTGVSVADVDQDGWMDIYVSTVNPHLKETSPNLLFHNKGPGTDGVPVFEEIAAQVGLADPSYCTQATFFDYDRDGDLDVYLLTNALENYTRNSPIGQRSDGTGKSVDKLFRNEGLTGGLPRFKDVSAEAGILTEGWGLGIVVSDVDQDGFPDVYAANDFLSNDHLYRNNGNGTFTNTIATALRHQEYNGMGADIGDINNDGLQDIVVVDMLPEDNLRQKTMFGGTGYDRFHKNIQMKYQPQYVRNVLQLNNGNGTFSDIGYLSGIYATDWSWSALIADLDNDGLQDILITNGYRKDITDLDFIAYSKESSMFGTDEVRLKNTMKAVDAIEGVKKPDLLFHNQGNLRFANASARWGMTQEAYSNGAAYADLDNDGDLDLVVNNINSEAFVYRNNTMEFPADRRHYLRLKLKGLPGNRQGVGAWVELRSGGKRQVREYGPQRGYQSTVEPFLHFGLDSASTADTLLVRWPSGRVQILTNVASNQLLELDESLATTEKPQAPATPAPLFNKAPASLGIRYRHAETDFIDFKATPTLPQKHSQSGPALAVGDLNGDGLEDVVVCGAANLPAHIFLQQKNGTFTRDSLATKAEEDGGLLLFDADHDGDLDLYCVSGSSEFYDNPQRYQDRFYRNDGKTLRPDPAALPAESSSGSCVTASDFDQDGDLDLFVGGRIVPRRYPESPESYLLENDGKGIFKEVTDARAPSMKHAGMVTAALWTDFDNDGWTDLALVGDWMPITFFKNRQGKTFTQVYAEAPGWWNSITGADFDQDGDTDYVCGNIGLNSLFQASPQQPVSIYAKDFDNNGSFDPLIGRYVQGKEYLTHPRETLTDQIVSYRRKLTRYSIYGKATRSDLLTPEQLAGALIYQANTLASTYLENQGQGKFTRRELPVQAQTAPLNGIQAADVNGDGRPDLVGIGNAYATDPLAGLYDAGIGVCLLGNGTGSFQALDVLHSGFFVNTDAKALVQLESIHHTPLWLAAANRDSLKVFEQATAPTYWITPGPLDNYAELEFSNGKKQKLELYHGAGYLSASTRRFAVPAGVRAAMLVDSQGKKRKVDLPPGLSRMAAAQ